MSETNNLSAALEMQRENLTNIANAIRTKSGIEGNILAKELASKILTLDTSGPSISLEIDKPPNKTDYYVGESFDPTGMIVSAISEEGEIIVDNDKLAFSPRGILEEGQDSISVFFEIDESPALAKQNISVIIKPVSIYGVEWDSNPNTKWTRTDDAAGFSDPVPYVAGATEYGSPFDNILPWSGMVVSERTGGTMVAIPKFWYKLTSYGDGGLKIQIADGEAEGFSVSPAHMDRGDGKGERDVVYIGRYHCASDYKSKTGVKPIANITRSTARSSIHGLGNNVWQSDFAMQFTIWLLYLVEFADWNSQNAIGYGCGNNRSTENMGYTDDMPYHTGTTQSNRTTYGLGTQYRNIEGLWDNIYDWCDGCYYNSNGMNIILNPMSFSDTTGGKSVGKPSGGYPSKFMITSAGGFPAFIPSESGGSDSTYTCDYWSFGASNPCLCVGGYYYLSAYGGLFFVNSSSASNTYGSIGSRLQELP